MKWILLPTRDYPETYDRYDAVGDWKVYRIQKRAGLYFCFVGDLGPDGRDWTLHHTSPTLNSAKRWFSRHWHLL